MQPLGVHLLSCCLQAAAFERIKSGCLAPFPRSQYALVNVQPFGSYANGLSLAASDIDVVITGVTYPDDGWGGAPSTPCPFSSAILLLQSVLLLASDADFAVYCCVLHVAAVPVFGKCCACCG